MISLRQVLALSLATAALTVFGGAVAVASCGGEAENVSISVSPSTLTFTSFGQEKTFTIKNDGNVPWKIHDFLTGGFQYTSTTCVTTEKEYAVNQTCTVTVRFTGTPAGKYHSEYAIVATKGAGDLVTMTLEGSY